MCLYILEQGMKKQLKIIYLWLFIVLLSTTEPYLIKKYKKLSTSSITVPPIRYLR